MAAVNDGPSLHRLLPMLLLFGLLLTALVLISDATQNSTRFGELYFWLLLFSALGLLLLTSLIGVSLVRLLRDFRRHEPGSRLSLRLVVIFMVLATVPVGVVYAFSLQFLQRGIDAWFDFRIEQALGDALELSRSSLDLRMREVLKQTQRMAEGLSDIQRSGAPARLDEMLNASEATELTLFSQNGRIVATVSIDPLTIVPHRLPDVVQMQVRQGHDYVSLDPIRNFGFHVRVVVPVPAPGATAEPRLLQALFPVPRRLGDLADSVQSSFDSYRELAFLRTPLKTSFILTLSLVLAFGVLAAVWTALYSAQRLVAPIRDLAEGTRAVAAGEFDQQLPLNSNDELGFLVHSFNQMTRNLARARAAEQRSQQLLEQQRAYLEAVLARLSSGVLTLDQDGRLHTYNAAAEQILHTRLADLVDRSGTADTAPHVQQFFQLLREQLLQNSGDWRQEITLFATGGRQVLMCRGSSLPATVGLTGGHVIVFDDITTLVQAQRDAAWTEVARRLAHEIKNPLTPIQLASERMRRKLLGELPADQARILDRSTHTIMQQVLALKEMVDAFNEYARPPRLKLERLVINRLIREVLYLYRDAPDGVDIVLDLDPTDPAVDVDAGRLRQLLHNLIKNGLDALGEHRDENRQPRLRIATRCRRQAGSGWLELIVEDNGPGFPDGLGNVFEPYVTTKPKGTGLGLAIVRKIVEEHNGLIELDSSAEGARVAVRLPVPSGTDAGLPTEHEEETG